MFSSMGGNIRSMEPRLMRSKVGQKPKKFTLFLKICFIIFFRLKESVQEDTYQLCLNGDRPFLYSSIQLLNFKKVRIKLSEIIIMKTDGQTDKRTDRRTEQWSHHLILKTEELSWDQKKGRQKLKAEKALCYNNCIVTSPGLNWKYKNDMQKCSL